MTRRRPTLALFTLFTAAVAIVTAAFGAPPATAPDCPRGRLDARYCDRDGDLVADPPSDPRALVDPKTLVFSYSPLEDPSVYREVWKEFLEHLSRLTGRKVIFFPVQSNAAQIEAMRAGRIHVAGYNTGSVPYAVNVSGFVPFAMMGNADGAWGYEMEIVVRAESPIREVRDLRGKSIAFTSPTSNSGYKAPKWILETRFGLAESRDYRGAFAGKHDQAVLGVVHGDYDAACVANSVLRQMERRHVVDVATLRTVYKSETFPTTAYGVAWNLEPALAAKVRDAFFSFRWAGTGLEREFRDTEGERFLPIRYKDAWSTVREIDDALGVTYGIPK